MQITPSPITAQPTTNELLELMVTDCAIFMGIVFLLVPSLVNFALWLHEGTTPASSALIFTTASIIIFTTFSFALVSARSGLFNPKFDWFIVFLAEFDSQCAQFSLTPWTGYRTWPLPSWPR
ncbi:hypothetical protein B0H19DRAFT_1100179 [Mycena capillaripes]|nr:hypothetical protein B0H19DRAFT_1100179 [Mycena capillaripes]